MGTFKCMKLEADRAVALVGKIREIASELASAIADNDGLNKYRFDTAITEKAKCVEETKKKYVEIEDVFDGLTEQLESAKKRLDDITAEYENIVCSNNSLRKMLQSVKCEKSCSDDDTKLSDDTRFKLQLYKKMTGILFDFNLPDEDLAGFVTCKECHHRSEIVPFFFKKSSPNLTSHMWAKIGDVLHNSSDDIDELSSEIQSKLQIQ